MYAGKERIPRGQLSSSNTVMELVRPLLEEVQILCTDNFYTSVSLAHELNENQTHLVGTLGKRRKMNPKSVEQKQLDRGQMVAKESKTGVIVGKWKDTRDVMFLTTKSVPTLVETPTRRVVNKKPTTVLQYNAGKSQIDVPDQLASYGTSVRPGLKWYRKVMFKLLTNTAVVNAHIIYKSTVL